MALAPTSPPQYANVPRSPGVPPMMRSAGAVENTVVAVASDAIQIVKQLLGLGPQWGIWWSSGDKAGQPVLQADSVISVDYRQEWQIATYPIERGAFNSYNKVKTPFDVRITFAVAGNQSLLGSLIPGGALLSGLGVLGGSSDGRRQMLSDIDTAVGNKKDLMTVVTPEATYQNMMLMHYDYRREARGGVSIIRVECWLQEIRLTPKGAFTSGEVPNTDPISGDKSAQPGGSGGDAGSSGKGSGPGGSPSSGSPAPGNGAADAPKNPQSAAPQSGGSPQPQQQGPSSSLPDPPPAPKPTVTIQQLGEGGAPATGLNTVPILNADGTPATITAPGGVTQQQMASSPFAINHTGQSWGSYVDGMTSQGYTPNYAPGMHYPDAPISWTKH